MAIVPYQIRDIVRYASPDRTILFLGAPGIGKSLMTQEGAKLRAKDRGKKFVELTNNLTIEQLKDILENPDEYFLFYDMRLSIAEPQDLAGRLEDIEIEYNGGKISATTYKPPLWAILMSKVEGVLFLDELLDVQRPDVKAASYQLLLDKRSGDVRLRDDILVVAASNTERYSTLSQGLTLPQARRLRIYEIREPTVDEWIKFMYERYDNNWDISVAIFLQHHKELFFKLPAEQLKGGDTTQVIFKTETYETYPCPDTWTLLAVSLHKEKELLKHVDLIEYVASFVGESAAATFKTFFEYTIQIDLQKLLKDPNQVKNFDWNKKMAVISKIASEVNENITSIVKYKPLVDALVFDKAISDDFVAILKSTVKANDLTEKELNELAKYIDEETMFYIRNGGELARRNNIAMFILSYMDERYVDIMKRLIDIGTKLNVFSNLRR